jgi:flagellum-specific ATP synthase
MIAELLTKYNMAIRATDPIKFKGKITKVQGLLIESLGPQAVVGELCQIEIPKGRGTVWAEVVGLREKYVQLMPFDDVEGIEVGCEVVALGESLSVPVSDKLLGRVLDGMGRPMDGNGDIGSTKRYTVFRQPPTALERKPITEKVTTGIRSIDGLTPLGKGQRIGIFAGSGVGKSTLLGMVARNTDADVNVVALIGERGREVREFMEHDLGPEGLKKSVLIVSTSNTPPLARLRGAYVATAVAEYFRDQGKSVMLLFDSVTRFANAQREIGLAIGEPPATGGIRLASSALCPKYWNARGPIKRDLSRGFTPSWWMGTIWMSRYRTTPGSPGRPCGPLPSPCRGQPLSGHRRSQICEPPGPPRFQIRGTRRSWERYEGIWPSTLKLRTSSLPELTWRVPTRLWTTP